MTSLKVHPGLKYVPLFFLISLIIVVTVILFYAQKTIIGYVTYPVDYAVGSYQGFNLDSDAIHFGTILPGVVVKRKLVVETSQDALIHVALYGMKGLELDENDFFLKSGESKAITVTLFIPKKADEGYYNGKLVIVYKRPNQSSQGI